MIATMTNEMREQNPSIVKPDKKARANNTGFIILYLVIVVGFVAIGPRLFSSSWISSSDFHSCIEICSSFIAIIAAIACLVHYFGSKERYYLICGLGFFICGGEDLIHGLLSFSRFFSGIEADLSKFVPGTYVAGRCMFAIFIILAAALGDRSRFTKDIRKETVFFSLVAMIVACVVTALAIMLPLPQFIYPEQLISRPVDFISAVLFAIAFVMVLKRYIYERSIFSGFLLSCILLNLGGQIYMSFSKQLFDAFFDTAHWANILSYCMPVLGIAIQALKEMKKSERELVTRKHAEKALQEQHDHLEEVVEKRTSELTTANKGLKEEITEREHAEEQLKHAQAELQKQVTELVEARQAALNMMEDIECEINERKKAEQNLKAAKEQAELICRVVPSAIFSVDKEKRITSWNNKAVEITGYTAEEALGKKCTMFTLTPCVDKCGLYSNDVEKPVIAGECTIKRKDGEIRTILKNADFLKDTNGNIIGGIESFEDVTELRQIEQEQKELLHNLKERVKELDCMYGVADSIRRRTTLDEIFKDIVATIPPGWRYPYITRAKICFDGVEYISEPFGETPWKQTSDIIVSGEPCGCVEAYYLEECPALDEGPFLKEERDLIAGIARALSEAVELKRAEEKVKELAKFPSEDPNPIIKISKDCTILYANDAGSPLLETWGCKVGERLPQPHSTLVEKVLDSGEAITCELDSSDQVFSVTLAPVVKSGYVNVYGLDITELRLSKEHLKQAREQAEIKSLFVSTVSHELRTPLTTMKEGVSIVLDGIAGEINDKQRHFLDIAKRNIDRLSRLINDVLDFQKLEAGKMEVDMQRNDMNKVIEDVIETMASSANEKGLELIAKLDETMPMVNFDRDRIIQVLTNLVDNAIKFTEKGKITIATTGGDDTVRISVRDTGPGMKKEDLPKLFREFEQLSDSNERKTGGTGLGLSISRKIVEKHNGKIWAESEFGKGTTFYFELPIQEKLAMAAKL